MERAARREGRVAEAMAALDQVMDPELDAPVTGMGFIETLNVDDGDIDVVFRLPTFWCAANFAYLMGCDMQLALRGLPWADKVRVRLVDHFAATRINAGLAGDWPFERVFSGEADGGLDRLRRTFADKAFLGRQSELIQLLRRRMSPTELLGLDVGALMEMTRHDADPDCRAAAGRHLSARRAREGGGQRHAPAFVTLEGAPIPADQLQSFLREARRVTGAARANAALCRMQLEARYQGMDKGAGTALERERYER